MRIVHYDALAWSANVDTRRPAEIPEPSGVQADGQAGKESIHETQRNDGARSGGGAELVSVG